jgi:hypothetical protein
MIQRFDSFDTIDSPILEPLGEHHETMPSTPEETANYIRSEANKWGKLIKETGIKAN